MEAKCPFHARSDTSAPQNPLQSPPPGPTDSRPPISQLLKEQTRALHDAAEHHDFNRGVIRGGEEYGAFLAQMVCIHATLESALRVTATHAPDIRAMLRPHHERLALLCDDLDALGIPGAELAPLPAATALCDLILASAAHDHPALVGIWYVLEGSTNGGAVIAKNVRDVRGFTDSRGTAFVNPHGPRVRLAWTEFKAGLDAMHLDDAARERMVAAASRTFRLFGDLLEQLSSRAASRAASPA